MSIVAETRNKLADLTAFNLTLGAVDDYLDEIVEMFRYVYKGHDSRVNGRNVVVLPYFRGGEAHIYKNINVGVKEFECKFEIELIFTPSGSRIRQKVFHSFKVSTKVGVNDLDVKFSNSKLDGESAKFKVGNVHFLKELIDTSVDVLFEDVMSEAIESGFEVKL